MQLTPAILERAMGSTAERAATFARHLDAACAFYGISATVQRLAAFLAQIGHESGSLRYVRELADGSAYEGRRDLGNTEPGDGKRYRGRGLIQTTGRANAARVRDRLRARLGSRVPDFEATPEALELPEWAAWSAADYWDMRGLNDFADADDFLTITRRINGGTNGQGDRQARWERARMALADIAAAPAPIVDRSTPTEQPAAPAQEPDMPLPAFIAAALPTIVQSIPQLGRLFGSGSEVAERNVKAAEVVATIVQQATGTNNVQAAAEVLASDPAARAAAVQAVQERWFEISESGGGGIEGARKADAERSAGADKIRDVLKSHSFWIALALLPLVYIVVLSIIGVIGTATWSDDVRASIAGLIVGTITGGLMGYYFGQTTSRNRGPAG